MAIKNPREKLMLISKGGECYGVVKLRHEPGSLKLKGAAFQTEDRAKILEFRMTFEMTPDGPRFIVKYDDGTDQQEIRIEPKSGQDSNPYPLEGKSR